MTARPYVPPLLLRLAHATPVDAAMDLLYDAVDGMLLAGEFEGVDDLLALADVSDYPPAVLVGFLTVTYAAKDLLPARAGYGERVRARLAAEMPPERLTAVLRDLLDGSAVAP